MKDKANINIVRCVSNGMHSATRAPFSVILYKSGQELVRMSP